MCTKEKIDLDDCHNNDSIWGLAIKMSFDLVDNCVCHKDQILHRLIYIGIHNWTGVNVWGPEGIRSMMYREVLGNRLFKLVEESMKVH